MNWDSSVHTTGYHNGKSLHYYASRASIVNVCADRYSRMRLSGYLVSRTGLSRALWPDSGHRLASYCVAPPEHQVTSNVSISLTIVLICFGRTERRNASILECSKAARLSSRWHPGDLNAENRSLRLKMDRDWKLRIASRHIGDSQMNDSSSFATGLPIIGQFEVHIETSIQRLIRVINHCFSQLSHCATIYYNLFITGGVLSQWVFVPTNLIFLSSLGHSHGGYARRGQVALGEATRRGIPRQAVQRSLDGGAVWQDEGIFVYYHYISHCTYKRWLFFYDTLEMTSQDELRLL